MSLDVFSPVVAEWFRSSFDEPTRAQEEGWPAIASGEHTLILAPTGSGKTLAAFLYAIDRLSSTVPPEPAPGTRLLYISPLRALAVDVEKNLRAPLAGIEHAADRLGTSLGHRPTVGMRTGDTPAAERRRLLKGPPDILITTPESLYLMLTSQARETLRDVRWVVIDEIHAMAATKRGAHLALSLERLGCLTGTQPQRIGLSATQRPLDEIARFLGGADDDGPRSVTVVDAGIRKPMEIQVVVPVDDMAAIGRMQDLPASGPASAATPRTSIWPSIHPRLLELIRAHRSTIVFVNARRLAERLAARLNELAGEDLVRAHHGSLAREQRLEVEDALKQGTLRAIVATSSLELGIDMGAVDLVVQVESPGSVASGLQRIGRAGHQVGEPSRGIIFPKYRGDLLEAAVVSERMLAGLIEETRYPRNPLDVLAQQIVAMAAMDEWHIDQLARVIRRTATFADLSDEVFHAVLDLLAGRYPSDAFAGLRPRITWDRATGVIRGREGAGRIAVTNAGTIPDRGLFGVFMPDGTRVGELDEEMVYETRAGEVFMLGASSWRVQDITRDRVVVSPAPGEPGKMPFWHGSKPGRPLELGRALGAFTRELGRAPREEATVRLRDRIGLDERACDNLIRYLEDQRAATGTVPDDRTIVIERFPDELGDWRVCILSPFGARVHAPWGLAIEARLAERMEPGGQVLWSDDGIVIRLPEALTDLPVADLLFDPDEIEELVVRTLPQTALFASAFREAAARALLLPRRRPGQRTPLWQQRQRSADLLVEASRHPTFPILLETIRECVRDVFDVPALKEVMADLRSRRTALVSVDTPQASPFAQSLVFNWVASYMYAGDAPLAERRATALSLDRDLLRELLGAEELRELLDPAAIDQLELELQRLTPEREATRVDDLHDLLRILGDLTREELGQRSRRGAEVDAWLSELVAETRVIRVRVAGEERFAAVEDAARFRDGLGVVLPRGLPTTFTEASLAPLEGLVERFARTHSPFVPREVSTRLGVGEDRVRAALEALGSAGRVVHGEFRPGGSEREWCDVEVLRRIRRLSLAALRKEVEPVDGAAFARFLPRWHGVGAAARASDADALAHAVAGLQGAAVAASVLESEILPARVRGYRPADLDAMCAAGELVWTGAGPLGTGDGRVVLCYRDRARVLLPAPSDGPRDPLHEAIRAHLRSAGASFWPDLVRAAGIADQQAVLSALWDLVWAGEITNDTFAPLRAFIAGSRRRSTSSRPRPGGVRSAGPPAGAGRWSLVSPLLDPLASPTEIAHARSLQLLERHGVVTREAVLAEGTPGGFAGVYGVLKEMEGTGAVRRGYFVDGLGAAQFALPGAVDRLRSSREDDTGELVVLAATDPAQPYGAALPWPSTAGRPARVSGAYLVLVGGEPGVFLDRGGRSIATFGLEPCRWVDGLSSLLKDGTLRRIELERIDGVPIADAPAAASAMREAGFVDGYRGLQLRV